MSDGKLITKLLNEPAGTRQPVLPRGTLLRSVVEQVNRNTVALKPPRQAAAALSQTARDGTIYEDSNAGAAAAADSTLDVGGQRVFDEIQKNSDTVDISGVSIARRTSSQFVNLSTGEIMWLRFDNSDLE